MITAYMAWQDEIERGTIKVTKVELIRSMGKLWHKGKPVWLEKPIKEETLYMYSFDENKAVNKLVEAVFRNGKSNRL